MNTTLTPSLLVKLASLVSHMQEFAVERDVQAARFDIDAAKGLVEDPEVVAWIATIDPVLLPERRS